MPSVLADLVVNLIGDDTSLLLATKRSAAAMEGMAGTADTIKASVQTMGKYAGLALVAIGGYSIKAASDFQAAMEQIHTQAGASQQEVDSLTKSVLNMAPAVGIGPQQLAEGLYHVESAGFRGKVALDILEMAAKNAATGMSDMEDAAQAMIGVMAVGFKDVTSAADAAAYLNTTVGIGDMRMQQLSSAIATNVLPTFAEAGLGMKDFSAAIATITDNVTPANMAATRLRMTIALFSAPTKQAFNALRAVGLGADEANKALGNRQYLEKYGISISKLSEDLHKPDGLLVAVDDLKSHLQTAGLTATEQTAVIERAFGGGRTSAAIQTLLMESDRLKSKYDALGTSASRAKAQQDSWAATQQTFHQQAKQLGASLQVMAIQLGTKLLPPLTKFVEYLNSHKGAMQTFFIVMLIFLGLMTIAFIAMGIAAIAASWEILLIIAAVALVALGIYELVKHWGTVWKWIKNIAMDVWHWLVNVWHNTWRDIMSVVNWIKKEIVDPIVRFFLMLGRFFVSVWHGIEAVVAWIWNHIIAPVIRFFMMLYHGVMSFIMGIVNFFKKWWPLLLVIFAPPIAIIIAIWNHFHRQITSTVMSVWHAILSFLKMVWNGIKDAAVFVWHLIYDYIVKPTEKLWHIITERWDALKENLQKAWDWIKGRAETAWKNIHDSIIKPIENVWHSLVEKFDNIKKSISDKFDEAWHTVEHIGDKFMSVGENIVHGIINGLTNGWHWLTDKISNLANDALDAAKKFLGIGSPSKLFANEVGKWIPAGISMGIDANVKMPQKSLNAMVTGTLRAGTTALRAGSPTGTALATAPHDDRPIQVDNYIDGQKMFTVMVTRAQRHKARNNSTFLT